MSAFTADEHPLTFPVADGATDLPHRYRALFTNRFGAAHAFCVSIFGGAEHLRYFKNLLTLAVETPATVRSCAAEVVLFPR